MEKVEIKPLADSENADFFADKINKFFGGLGVFCLFFFFQILRGLCFLVVSFYIEASLWIAHEAL